MNWSEVFIVFFVSHLFGDFVLQTEWQAMNKRNGLGSDPECRRALLSHVVSYTVAYVPALVWLGAEHSGAALAATVLAIAVPHLIQDDGRLLRAYVARVKRTDPGPSPLYTWVDFSFHMLALFALAVVLNT